MTSPLGTIRGQIRIDVTQALAAYASVRRANETTRVALTSAAASFAKVGAGALLAAAPIALLFKTAITSAADFQKKIDFFGAVTNASQADMDAVAKKAIDMSRTTVYSASQMADAFVEFGKAGISTKDIIGGVADATTSLAQAADISVGDAANIIASTMATFQIQAKNTSHIADQLAGAANASIIDVSDVAQSLKYAGGIAATTGVSFDSLVTAISLLGQRGIKGSTAGTVLRQIMISLTSQTKKAHKALSDLGIITKKGGNEFITSAGKIKPLAQIMQILQDKEKGLTQAQQLAINKTIFNSRALAGVQILMRDGAKGFAQMQASIGKVSALDVAHKRLDNLSGDATHLKNSFQTLMIQVGQPLQNMARGIVQALTGMINWFSKLNPTVLKTGVYILGVVGILLTLFGTFTLGIALILKIIAIWKDFFLALKVVGTVIKSVIPLMRALAAAMIANPWVLVAVAIVAVVAAIIYCWNHFKGFRDFIKQAWADIKQWTMDVWNAVKTALIDAGNAIKTALNAIGDAAVAFGNGFMKYIVDPVVTAWNAVVNAFQTAYNFVTRIITDILKFIQIHWKAIILVIGAILGPVTLIMAVLVDIITTHWKAISNFIMVVLTGIKNIVMNSFNAVKDFVMRIFNGLRSYFTRVFNFYKTVITTAIRVIRAVITAEFNVINTVIRRIWNGIKAFFSAIWKQISGPLRSFWNSTASFFSGIWSRIRSIFSSAWSAITGILSRAVSTVGNLAARIGGALINGISNLAGRARSAIGGVVSAISGALWSFVADVYNIGTAIVQGIWNGISAMAGWLIDKVGSFVKSIWHTVTSFLGIHSPSRKGHYAGEMLVRGIANGVTKNARHAINAVDKMTRDMVATQAAAASMAVNISAQGQYAANGVNGAGPVAGLVIYGGLNVHNPIAEKTTTSLPRQIRKLNYMTSGPNR